MNTNTIKIQRNKNKILAISLIAIFAISIAMTFAAPASAQFQSGYGKNLTRSYTTGGYISVAPTLIGVGQTATVNVWVLPLPVNYNYGSWYFGPAGGSYTGVTVTFTKPDGTKDTFMPTDGVGTYPAGVLDALGTMYFYYTPSIAGNWSVTMTCPAQNFTDPTGTVMFSATSNTYYFTVTTQAQNAGLLNGWPYAQLPNANTYWTYPISSNNREWSAISGDFLSITLFPLGYLGGGCGGGYNPYSTAPSTGHILWDTQTYLGGIVGGSYGSISYEGYTSNIATTLNHVIMDGKLYVNLPTTTSLFKCFDLQTGKLLYTATEPAGCTITSGIHLPGNTYAQAVSGQGIQTDTLLANSYGASPTPYLFGSASATTGKLGTATTNWYYFNPVTGQLQTTITNVTANTYDFVDGSTLSWGTTYGLFNTTTYINKVNFIWEWNFTKVVGGDWWTGIMWTHTVNNPATGLLGPWDGVGRATISLSTDLSVMVEGGSQGDWILDGFSATDGHSLWNVSLGYQSQNDVKNDFLYGSNIAIGCEEEKNTIHAYSMLTGAELWKTALPTDGNNIWTTKAHYATPMNDKNNYYILSPAGTITALDIATGNIVWTSKAIPSTEESSNVLSIWDNCLEASGCLYVYSGYSVTYEINPIPRFSELQCINVTTGATIWTMNGGFDPEAIANGYLTGYSPLNGVVYCIGKGQTSTAVSAPTTAQPEGTSVLIQGNVLDQSPAQPGTPAVSDASMNQWMDYLNMQNATLQNTPPTPAGVQVTLTAVDPNMNTIVIGTTTTNAQGNYYYTWSPSTTGTYTITATFAGSGSYWPSNAQTGVLVTAAAAPVSTSTTTTTSSGVSTTALYTIGAAIIIVIIIVGAVLGFLMLRKRP